MSTAVPIAAGDLACLAAADARVNALTGTGHAGVESHPLRQRADQHTNSYVPVTVDELGRLTDQVDQLRELRPDMPLLLHADAAAYAAWALASCELGVTGTGAAMTWAVGVRPEREALRAVRRLRGEPVEDEPQAAPVRRFVRPSERGEDPAEVLRARRSSGAARGAA